MAESDRTSISRRAWITTTSGVVAAGLATPSELAEIAQALYRAAEDPDSVMSAPRIVQSWGRKA